MMAGIAMATWGQLRNRTSTFADFFPNWETVGRLVVSTVLALLLIAAGLLLFVLPGIYLIVAYSFSYMLIADRHLGAWQALEASRRVVTRNWWGIFWLTGVMLLLIMGGGIFGAALLGFPLGYSRAARDGGSGESGNDGRPPQWNDDRWRIGDCPLRMHVRGGLRRYLRPCIATAADGLTVLQIPSQRGGARICPRLIPFDLPQVQQDAIGLIRSMAHDANRPVQSRHVKLLSDRR